VLIVSLAFYERGMFKESALQIGESSPANALPFAAKNETRSPWGEEQASSCGMSVVSFVHNFAGRLALIINIAMRSNHYIKLQLQRNGNMKRPPKISFNHSPLGCTGAGKSALTASI
jgi:hypothetical protein